VECSYYARKPQNSTTSDEEECGPIFQSGDGRDVRSLDFSFGIQVVEQPDMPAWIRRSNTIGSKTLLKGVPRRVLRGLVPRKTKRAA